jgi:ribosomal protein S8
MNITQINLLISLKNTALAGKELLIVKYSYDCLKLISFLFLEGLIQSFFIEGDTIRILLRFLYGINKLMNLKILYRKSYKNSITYKMICKISRSSNLLIFSTDKGYLNATDCKIKRTGGKVLFLC